MEAKEFDRLANQHKKWLRSGRSDGKQLVLEGETIEEISITDGNLERCKLINCAINASDFTNTSFRGALIDKCAIKDGTILKNCNLKAMDVRDTLFAEIEMPYCNWLNTTLRDVDFKQVDFYLAANLIAFSPICTDGLEVIAVRNTGQFTAWMTMGGKGEWYGPLYDYIEHIKQSILKGAPEREVYLGIARFLRKAWLPYAAATWRNQLTDYEEGRD